MNPDIVEILRKFAEFYDEIKQYMDDSGFESISELLEAIEDQPDEQPSQVGWPPPFEFRLDKKGEDMGGNVVFELVLTNIDRDLTSFEIDFTDFDPDNDGTPDLVWAKLGPELDSLNWFFGFNEQKGRFGAFQSVIREYDDNPSVYEEIVLVRFALSEDDSFVLNNIGVGGNYDRGSGVDEHFTWQVGTDVAYTD